MTTVSDTAAQAAIGAAARELKLPTVKHRFRALAAEATREQQTPIAYLAALLEAEHQERIAELIAANVATAQSLFICMRQMPMSQLSKRVYYLARRRERDGG